MRRAVHLNLHAEGAQIGDDVAGRAIKISGAGGIPFGVGAGRIGSGIAVIDALIAIQRIHESLVVGLAVAACERNDGIGRLHPEHIGGVGSGIGDRRRFASGRELVLVGIFAEVAQGQVTGGEGRPIGSVEIDGVGAFDIGHPVLHRPVAVAGEQGQRVDQARREVDAGIAGGGIGREAVLIGEIRETLQLRGDREAGIDDAGVAQRRSEIGNERVGVASLIGEIERLIQDDADELAVDQIHRGGAGIQGGDLLGRLGGCCAVQHHSHIGVGDELAVFAAAASAGLRRQVAGALLIVEGNLLLDASYGIDGQQTGEVGVDVEQGHGGVHRTGACCQRWGRIASDLLENIEPEGIITRGGLGQRQILPRGWLARLCRRQLNREALRNDGTVRDREAGGGRGGARQREADQWNIGVSPVIEISSSGVPSSEVRPSSGVRPSKRIGVEIRCCEFTQLIEIEVGGSAGERGQRPVSGGVEGIGGEGGRIAHRIAGARGGFLVAATGVRWCRCRCCQGHGWSAQLRAGGGAGLDVPLPGGLEQRDVASKGKSGACAAEGHDLVVHTSGIAAEIPQGVLLGANNALYPVSIFTQPPQPGDLLRTDAPAGGPVLVEIGGCGTNDRAD